ncbi:DUF2057 domain-containing protein [Shewanella sp. WPAGA9]|uniref:YccT family protein n=1 Tax=Shewanella sp. ENK2 TaxID=2775245 RepID=UPI001780C664|nr:DUF2057 domain-containing protein [Shewanella sp. WPAGA9]
MTSKPLFTTLVITLFLSLVSPMSFAASILKLPSSAEVKLLNGQTFDGGREVTLVEGTNQIVFRYVINYRDSGMQTQFNSDPVILTFDANNAEYELSLPSIRNKNAANKFNKTPSVTLSSNQSNSVAYQADILRKDGLQLGRDYQEELLTYNQTQQLASVAAFAPTNTVPTNTVSTNTVSTNTVPTNVASASTVAPAQPQVITPKSIAEDQAEISEMLDYWYNKANAETKAKFKAKISQ